MHETVFSKKIVNVVNQKLKDLAAGSRIKSVYVKLSPLSHVKPQSLEEAFSQAAKAAGLDYVSLNIGLSDVELECNSCSKKRLIKTPQVVCSNCGSSDFEINQGPEFSIESIEVQRQIPTE